MSCDYSIPHPAGTSPRSHPYTSSISSSASSSSSSVFSVNDAASQASTSGTSTTSTNVGWESEEQWSRSGSLEARNQLSVDNVVIESLARANTFPQYQPPQPCTSSDRRVLPSCTEAPLPACQRQNARRSSGAKRPPPTLVRQEERKLNFVDNLVVSATQMVEVIWPLSVPSRPSQDYAGRGVLPLRIFIQETLRRSKTSYSTLQVALYYLILIKSHVPKHDFTMEQPHDMHAYRALQCGRRMFLAALILASKYLQDRNYSARAWSKISGLKVEEISINEMAFLQAVNWKLHITESVFERWQEVVLNYTPLQPPPSPGMNCMGTPFNAWKAIIPRLTPELDTIDIVPQMPSQKMVTPRIPQTPLPLPTPQHLATPSPRSTSQESTPTPSDYKLPKFLEPQLDMLPPTPALPRMAPLPTPQLTPQPNMTATPSWLRRPSMCSAMQQAQNLSLARSTLDWNPVRSSCSEGYPISSRRPSIAPSISSLSSSPESMVSDHSSRSSRASSISSVSSAGWAPGPTNKLCRLATCRNVKMLPHPTMLQKNSESMSTPDLESFHIDDETTLPFRPCPTSVSRSNSGDDCAKSRKRGRSSVDLSLQQNVRNLLNAASPSSAFKSHPTVLSDATTAHSFLLQSPSKTPCSKALQSPKNTVSERRLPVAKEMGRKRTCCAQEAARTLIGLGRARREM